MQDRPTHVAIIMDGNGRWAKARHLPRQAGHRAGIDALRRAVKAARDLGLSYLTVFGFSSENWKRPREEVDYLMDLLRFFIRRELSELHAQNVRVRIIGSREGLAADILDLIRETEAKTRDNTGLRFTIAFNYGARAELTLAVNAAVAKGGALTEAAIARHLMTADLPNPELVIRTSGEERLSNFLLWQAAGAELVFLPGHWPDFRQGDLAGALEVYATRMGKRA